MHGPPARMLCAVALSSGIALAGRALQTAPLPKEILVGLKSGQANIDPLGY